MEKVCVCGRTLEQFYKTGMLGCPKCYDTFGEEIDYAIEKIQHGKNHIGKKPSIDAHDRRLLNEYNTLIKEKENAFNQKRFSDVTEITLKLMGVMKELKEKGIL